MVAVKEYPREHLLEFLMVERLAILLVAEKVV